MASRRMIDPAFWQSESLMELDYRQRLLFIGLISNADDQGRLKGNPKLVKAMVFPFDDIAADEVEADLNELETVECIAIYRVGSKTCIQVLNWWSYQHPQWAYPSELPPMEGWRDQLRYRSGGKVITDNWKGEDEDEPTTPTSNALNGGGDDCYTHLPKALPKEMPKALGGSIVVSNSISNRDKESTTTTPACDNEFSKVTKTLAQRGLYLDGFTSQLVQECYDDIAPQGDETKLDWFEYACRESAGKRPNWNFIEAIIRGVADSGSLSAHKANRLQAKARDKPISGSSKLYVPKTVQDLVKQNAENSNPQGLF